MLASGAIVLFSAVTFLVLVGFLAARHRAHRTIERFAAPAEPPVDVGVELLTRRKPRADRSDPTTKVMAVARRKAEERAWQVAKELAEQRAREESERRLFEVAKRMAERRAWQVAMELAKTDRPTDKSAHS